MANVNTVVEHDDVMDEDDLDNDLSDTEVVSEAIEVLLDDMEKSLNGAKDKAMSRYKGGKILPIQRKGPGQEYWFRSQIIVLGKYYKYWANLDGFRDWIRFRIADEDFTLDLVVVGHLVRDPKKAVMVAYVEKKESNDSQNRRKTKITPYPVEDPFWISVDDDTAVQEESFKEWKKRAFQKALSYWEQEVPTIVIPSGPFVEEEDESDAEMRAAANSEPGDFDEFILAVD